MGCFNYSHHKHLPVKVRGLLDRKFVFAMDFTVQGIFSLHWYNLRCKASENAGSMKISPYLLVLVFQFYWDKKREFVEKLSFSMQKLLAY